MNEPLGHKALASRIVAIGLSVMAAAWLADAAVDAFFDHQPFWSQVVRPEPDEAIVRIIFLVFQLLFLGYAARLLYRHRHLQDALSTASQQVEIERLRSKAILEALGDGISIQDLDLKVLYQNPAHKRIMGEQKGQYCYRAYQGREAACPDCHLLRSFDDGQTHVRESTAATAGGMEHFEIISTPLLQPSGEVIAGIESVRNITERRRIEERLREQLAAMEGSIDGIAILDRDGVYTYLNQAHASIYGYDAPADLVGRNWRVLYDEPELERFDTAILPEFLARGRWRGEAEGLRRDGDRFPQEISLTATEGGGTVCVVRDISDRRRIEASARQMNRDLKQRAAELELANRELEAFGYSLSHDIRSYLTRISIAAQALEELSVDQVCADGNLCLKTILGSCEGMETLIEAMLVLARVNQQDLQLERVDLAAVARGVAEEMTQAEPFRNIRFEIPEKVAVDCDPHLLRVVLENLFSNACKYSRDREVAEVILAVRDREGRRVISIRDNGAGFDMAESDHLFQPFRRLGSARDYPGVGIGLTTVQRIIHRHGGEIWAESAPGKGAAFHFTLP